MIQDEISAILSKIEEVHEGRHKEVNHPGLHGQGQGGGEYCGQAQCIVWGDI